jgi:hypothetical protein
MLKVTLELGSSIILPHGESGTSSLGWGDPRLDYRYGIPRQ